MLIIETAILVQACYVLKATYLMVLIYKTATK